MIEGFRNLARLGAARAMLALAGGVLLGAPVALDMASGTGADTQFDTVQIERMMRLTTGENAALVDSGATAQARNRLIPLSREATAAMQGFAAIEAGSGQYGSALRCLTQAVYYEAANEPLQGQRGVAQVVLNRVRHPAYPNSVCGVVYEGWNRPVCQFSFVCDGALLRTPMRELWARSERVAREALDGYVEPSVGSATHYHADYVLPRWAFTLGKVTQIGAHIFYRFPGSGGASRNFRAAWSGVERIPHIDPASFVEEIEVAEDPLTLPETAAFVAPDPTDRHAPSDVGGRLDPSSGFSLNIPDPTQGSSHYARARQVQGAGADDTALAPTP